jgi:hypothetical protein
LLSFLVMNRESSGHTYISTLRREWAVIVALLLLTAVYLLTLQHHVNGSANDYLLDTGEIQVALNVWGTIHYTGYPLYTMLSALLTTMFCTAGLEPAAAASLPSLLWSLLALALAYRLLQQLVPGSRWLTAGGILALGLGETFWMHSIIAEVYSFSLLLATAVLLVGLHLNQQWSRRNWLLGLFLLGTAVNHHRLLLLLAPAFLLLILPQFPWVRLRQPRFWLWPMAAILLPFLAYLYLPLRAWQNAYWVYGQPGTWHGFWQQFTGSEVTDGLIRLPSGAEWRQNITFLSSHLARQYPLPVLGLGAIGLALLAQRRLWLGLALLMATAVYLLFVYLFPAAVWAPATLMPALLLLVAGVVYLLHRLPLPDWLGLAMLLTLATWLGRHNLPFVQQLVNDPSGQLIIDQLQPLNDAELPGGETVVAIPWGTTYFAANYGRYVSHTLENIRLVDHRANLPEIAIAEGSVLIPDFVFGFWSLDWWQQQLGSAYLAAPVPRMVQVSPHPLYQSASANTNFALGNGIIVRNAHLDCQDNQITLTVDWEAQQPILNDYSVAVHLLRQQPLADPADLLAQADASHPVAGWYPTTLWSPGIITRDSYILTIPPDTTPAALRITMYTQTADGSFVNGEWLVLPVSCGQ